MTTATHLIRQRRFFPLFVTQLLGAFNDNLFKNAMVLFVVYSLYNDEAQEAAFSGIASALFVLPFVTLSALSGQLADMRDKARIIRIVKAAEVGIMLVGAAGLAMAWKGIAVQTVAIPLMLAALFAMGVHSTFFGPIKYAILPQHLRPEEVLAGTGLVEAGTYIAILAGTILAGWIPIEWAALVVIVTALVGYVTARQVPSAPPLGEIQPLDFNILRASIVLVRNTMHDRRVFLAIGAISFFWSVGTILFIQFPPLAKNVLHASKEVASLFLVIFSVGIAIGSMSINHLLKGRVSARFGPVSVLVMLRCRGLGGLHALAGRKRWRTDERRRVRPSAARRAAAAHLARHRHCRRDVRRAAIRLPHHVRGQGADRSDHRGKQHRQRGRDGRRRAAGNGPQRGRGADRPAIVAQRGDVRDFGLARPAAPPQRRPAGAGYVGPFSSKTLKPR